MPPLRRPARPPSPERAARIERIQDLLALRRHPERRVGLFSATNLTRLALRLGAMGLAAAAVHGLLGTSVFEAPVAAIAIGAADYGVERLWRRIRERVRQAWTVVGILAAALFVALLLLFKAAPESGMAAALRGWKERQEAGLDERQRATRVAVDEAAVTDPHWRLLTQDGAIRKGTHAEALAWCSALGPEWRLPLGLGMLPDLERWPALDRPMYVWTQGGTGLQVGDGQRPAVGVSGSGRPTEVRAVLCLREGGPDGH